MGGLETLLAALTFALILGGVAAIGCGLVMIGAALRERWLRRGKEAKGANANV